jgi:hypothetical protein
MLEKVCLPVIHGQAVKEVAQANGLRHYRDNWLLQGPGIERIIITMPTVANPNVCQATLNYEIGQTAGVAGVLGNWAASQTPPLQVLSSNYAAGPGVTGWTWEAGDGTRHEGLVFDHQQTPEGKPLGKDFDVGTVLFSAKGV